MISAVPSAAVEPEQTRLVAAMRAPGFFGYAQVAEVKETHCSWVFLTDGRAFKLKKAIVLPFLDYGTVERRRVMCEEEVRLNRRLAPDIYSGVGSVIPAPDGYTLAAHDDPRAVDYVVEMHRFREEDTLAAKLAAGTATPADVRAIGERLAEFHASAPRKGSDWPGGLVSALEDSLRDIESMGGSGERHWAAVLRRFARSYVGRNGQMLRARAAAVREGHGDLRAEHMVLGEHLQIVDCIEFDARLRERDVASDLAFLVMDLELHGKPHLVDQLIASYAAAGGDAGPSRLLPFYALERALVRAKVALVRAGQHRDSPEARVSARDADALLRLAQRFAWQARAPLAIVMCGLSGSGKSYLSHQLSLASGFPVLNSDVVRKELFRIPPGAHAGAEYYTPESNERTYAELASRADAALAQGGVVIDATFRHPDDRATFLSHMRDAASRPLWIHCDAPHAVLEERVARRAEMRNDPSDADLDVLAGQRFAPLVEPTPEDVLELRTDRPAEEALDDVEAWLDLRAPAGLTD